MNNIELLWSNLNDTSAKIFSIDPTYQDKAFQTPVPMPYLESIGVYKLYDSMRKGYVLNDSQGHIIPNIDIPQNRSTQ